MSAPASDRTPAASNLVLHGILWAVAAAALHSLVPVAVRWLSATLPAIEIVFLRNVLGFLFLLALYAGRGFGQLRTKRMGIHVQRSLTNFLGMWLWFAGLAVLPIGQAVALQFTLPLFTVVLAMLFLAERPGAVRILATLVGFGGVLVILRPGAMEIGLPVALVLGSAALYGATQVYTRVIGRTDDPGVTTFYYQAFLTLFAAGPALWSWVMPSLDDVPAILLLAFAGTAAPYCLIRALHHAEATATAPFDFLRLPFTIFMGFVFFGEATDLWVWVGGAIIFGSSYFVSWREAKAGRGGH